MFKGIATPVVTPLQQDQQIDYAASEKIIEFLLSGGMDGLLFFGSCGEFFAFSPEQKRQFIRFVCEKVHGRCKVLIGTGSTDMRETLRLTHYAADQGADAAVIVSPYYFSFDEDTISHFYRTILRQARLPVIAYNFPERTGYNLTADQLKQLALEFPHFIGVKDTIDGISHTREIIQAIKPLRPDFRVYSGYDEYYLPNLIAGGDGAIAGISNIFPKVFRNLYDAFYRNDFSTACQCAAFISDAMPVYKMSTPFIPAIKAAMMSLGLPVSTQSGDPVRQLSTEQITMISTFIRELQEKQQSM